MYLPPDRRVLERTILPFYAANEGIRRVLFVGVAPYTARYRELFPGRVFATIDTNEGRAHLGGDPHVVGSVTDLDRHFAPDSFDFVAFNGVLGFGLDEPPKARAAFQAIARTLAKGGSLLVGVNPQFAKIVDLDEHPLLGLFTPVVLSPLSGNRLTVDTPFRERRHSFYFFEKR
ncbi:MAG: class I SAM-dependent methyltransferase [Polyangiaceae bacterium]